MISDLASVSRNRQYSVGQRGAIRKETEAALNTPIRVEKIGRKTIKGRTLASVGSPSASGASYITAVMAGSSVPLAAIPVSTIAAGVYWYKSVR